MRWWGWLIVALIVWWVIKHPTPASNDVHSIGDFFSSLTS
jgi:hypothetical protein